MILVLHSACTYNAQQNIFFYANEFTVDHSTGQNNKTCNYTKHRKKSDGSQKTNNSFTVLKDIARYENVFKDIETFIIDTQKVLNMLAPSIIK